MRRKGTLNGRRRGLAVYKEKRDRKWEEERASSLGREEGQET